jgi:hypothetical protein
LITVSLIWQQLNVDLTLLTHLALQIIVHSKLLRVLSLLALKRLKIVQGHRQMKHALLALTELLTELCADTSLIIVRLCARNK